MSAGDVVACWILALPAVVAFYLAYGLVEEIIQRRASPRISDPARRTSKPSTVEPPPKDDMAPAVHEYDSPELFSMEADLASASRVPTSSMIPETLWGRVPKSHHKNPRLLTAYMAAILANSRFEG